MLIEKVLKEAKAYLDGVKIQDAVVGLSLIGIELDNSNIGVTYVLREGLRAGCSIFPYVQKIIGEDAWKIAQWILTGDDDIQRGIGMAVLTAASRSLDLKDADTSVNPFSVAVSEEDTIGMIGYIAPVASQLGKKAKEVIIFDKGISQCGGVNGRVMPMEEQEKLLPRCDIVVLSGTTMINGTFDRLWEMCKNAREIILMGSSCPMYPQAFADTNVTVLAGSWWNSDDKNDIFKVISLAGGISHLSKYSLKKTIRPQQEVVSRI